MPQLDPKIGEIYKHFKGNLYQVRNLAIDAETGRKMVVYQALYGDFSTYVRDFDEFISDVDYEKYPECTLRFRFTLVPEGQLRAEANRAAARALDSERSASENRHNSFEKKTADRGISEKAALEEIHKTADRRISERTVTDEIQKSADRRISERVVPDEITEQNPRMKSIQDLMMDFFDERDFVKKEKILSEMKLRDDLTDSVIDNLAAAIDVVIDEGPLDQRFAELRTCVSTRARFENTRLRG